MERTVNFLANELKCVDKAEAEDRVFFVSAKEVNINSYFFVFCCVRRPFCVCNVNSTLFCNWSCLTFSEMFAWLIMGQKCIFHFISSVMFLTFVVEFNEKNARKPGHA